MKWHLIYVYIRDIIHPNLGELYVPFLECVLETDNPYILSFATTLLAKTGNDSIERAWLVAELRIGIKESRFTSPTDIELGLIPLETFRNTEEQLEEKDSFHGSVKSIVGTRFSYREVLRRDP